MNFKNLVLIFILLYAMKSMASESCTINTWNKIYTSDQGTVDVSTLIKESDCSDSLKLKFVDAISKYEGQIPSYQLSEEIGSQVSITPKKIAIDSLDNLLRSKLNLSDKHKFNEIKGHTFNALTLEEAEQVSVKLPNIGLGQKHIALEVTNPISGAIKKHWLSAVLKVKTKALVSKSYLSFNNSGIETDQFEIKEIYSEHPDRLFANFNQLQFHRVGRPIAQGQVVKKNDLSPLLLVRVGVPASVVYKNNNLNLSSKAVPSNSGKFGDVIRLKTKTNKIITGRVLDFNKVEIRL